MVNMRKRFVAVLLIALFVVNGGGKYALAGDGGNSENDRVVRTVYEKNEKNLVFYNQSFESKDMAIHEGQVRANEPPTREHVLSERAYHYQFSGVDNFTFTRFYFKPHADGHLIISVDNWDSGGAEVKIQLYVKRPFPFSDEVVDTWTGDPATILGIGYTSLDPDKNYYFKFLPYMAESISGEGYIKY